jgi:hypothetical protein
MKQCVLSFLIFTAFVLSLLVISARQTSAQDAMILPQPVAQLQCLPTIRADMDMCPPDCCSGPLDGEVIGAFASSCAACGGQPEVSIDTTAGGVCPTGTSACGISN